MDEVPVETSGRMAAANPFWLRRPSARSALASCGVAVALAVGAAMVADRVSPLAARSSLPLDDSDVREVFLSSDASDPARVLATTRRRNTTVSRDRAALGGNRYWLRRYADPTRPGIPERRLLTSRSRGARLYVPIAAVDLERALSQTATPPGALELRSELVFLYEDRLFRGLFLELRFPLREPDPLHEWRRFDLVAVRGSEVRSVDWVLHPYPRFYREWIAAGRLPEPPAFSSETAAGRELVFALYADLESPAAPLWLPISLYDELGLMWGDDLPQLQDDRWQPETTPALAWQPADLTRRVWLWQLLGVHLAARLEQGDAQAGLERRAAELLGS